MRQAVRIAVRRPIWVAQKSYLWGRSIAQQRADDCILAFFPKTGSTWVRLVLYNLLSARAGLNTDALSFDALDRAMPEFANPSNFARWPFSGTPRLVKTHQPFRRIWAGHTAIVFCRDPRDTMVSYYHYARASRAIGFSGDLNALIRDPHMGLDAYFRFFQSWQPHAHLRVRYEDLRAQPGRSFRQVLTGLGIAASDHEIDRALAASTLAKTRKAQAQSSARHKGTFTKGFEFARRGQVGDGRAAFDQDMTTYYLERKQHWGFQDYA